MNAIVNTAPGRLEMQDLPLPEPGEGEVRIRTGACGICATDLVMIDGWTRTGFPSVPGHEWCGTVDAVGPGVDGGLVGRRCVAENVLADGAEVGFEHPGGYGECFITEAGRLQLLPDDFPFAAGVLIEPLAVCVRGIRRLRLEDTTRTLVFGDGPIGLIMVILLRRAGAADVVLVGGRDERLQLAGELGATRTLNYHELDGPLAAGIAETGSGGFPNVIEASGSSAAADAAVVLAAPGGKVLLVGDYGDARADFAWNRVLLGEIELIGTNASAHAWPEAVRLAVEEKLPLDRLVTHRLPASRFAEGLALTRDRTSGAVKVVLEWPQPRRRHADERQPRTNPRRPRKG
ncbi:MAG TPA: zinc-binding dehydrogenase [Planctomycetota bacterium]|nr:zinc-binding dehydrogenase [Planctomycetota bacterium]